MLNQNPNSTTPRPLKSWVPPLVPTWHSGFPDWTIFWWNSTEAGFRIHSMGYFMLLTEKCEWYQENLYSKKYGKLIFKFIELFFFRFMNLLHFGEATSSYKFFEDWPSLHFVQPMGWHKYGDMAAWTQCLVVHDSMEKHGQSMPILHTLRCNWWEKNTFWKVKNNCLLLNYTKLLNQGLPKFFDAEFNSATHHDSALPVWWWNPYAYPVASPIWIITMNIFITTSTITKMCKHTSPWYKYSK